MEDVTEEEDNAVFEDRFDRIIIIMLLKIMIVVWQ
jgi:hypothetical protein